LKHKKLWVFVGIIVLILVLNHVFGWSRYLSDPDNLSFLKTMVKENFLMAALIYMGITIVSCVVLALPGVTFAILAGLIFGPVMGTVLCCVSTTLGAMVAFLVGRYFLQDTIRPRASENKYLKKWLFDESGRNEMFILMITRLVPVFPYNLQNFAYGITDIGFIEYSVGSFLFMIPGTAMYTIGTAGLADPHNRKLYIGIALVIAAVVIAAGMILKKKYVQPEGEKKENE
jgi:uncharacterized membrane protein YdjX (TVP38/TMEM64 family)